MEKHDLCCTLNMPYPKICRAQLNKNDSVMIKRLYAYKFCSLNDYIFQSIILSHEYPSIADLLDCISMTELLHFKMYGRLLSQSGEHTELRELIGFGSKQRRVKLSGASLGDILEYNFRSETESASNVRLVLSQVYDECAVNLLRRILLDEEHHRELMTVMKKRYE